MCHATGWWWSYQARCCPGNTSELIHRYLRKAMVFSPLREALCWHMERRVRVLHISHQLSPTNNKHRQGSEGWGKEVLLWLGWSEHKEWHGGIHGGPLLEISAMCEALATAFHGLNSKRPFDQALSATLPQPTVHPSECSEQLPIMKAHYNFRASVDPMELIPETPSQNV